MGLLAAGRLSAGQGRCWPISARYIPTASHRQFPPDQLADGKSRYPTAPSEVHEARSDEFIRRLPHTLPLERERSLEFRSCPELRWRTSDAATLQPTARRLRPDRKAVASPLGPGHPCRARPSDGRAAGIRPPFGLRR